VKSAPEIKVLVVEDDAYFQRVLVKRLEAEGYQVLTACDGREGMKAIVANDPDLVISDWMMPHVDGLELCQALKTGLKESAPYFILLTAKGEIDDRLLGLDTGADDYLVKPCEQGELMARVRAGLRSVLLARELRERVAELQALNSELDESRAEARRLATLSSCPSCRRVRGPDGRWEDLHGHLSRAGLLKRGESPCPACNETRSDLVEDRAGHEA
jgi:sigma-B regulation protein RsbU (phosphoserine phosphatase)